MYAFVRFFEDDMCYALPVSTVEDFRPLHRTDFDNQKVYLVHRTEENGSSAGQPSEAQILALADTVEEFEDSIMQKKMKIPKMSIKNSGNSIENNFGEERMPLRHKKALSQDHGRPLSNSSKSLAAVVARLERNAASSSVVPRVLQLVQQAKKLKEYGSLLTEVKELRDFNRRLQDVLLMRLGSEPMHDNGTQTIKAEIVEPIVEAQETCREEANTSSSYSPSPRTVYTCNDGKEMLCFLLTPMNLPSASISPLAAHLEEPGGRLDRREIGLTYATCAESVHLGGGIWVEEEKWHQLQRTQGDSKFTKNLAVMIWGTETLKNRSVTGVATKKKKDALPKPPLSPSKLKIVRECLYDRVSQETADSAEITQRLSKVNKYICEKIMDINKSIKNEERRESKLLIRQTVKVESFTYDGM
ncbi:hypothetical protein JOQ06_005992 [Pogonophryne albipinna]|uniref:BEN domain-containing protein 5 n=1 Tax=Pogonophryne albipinna TaxID=1090488 RepID=A0AAD6FQ11_9TELE|nr:hypothetical protein JOQ06_005992 [Pogonophryne albipinna]